MCERVVILRDFFQGFFLCVTTKTFVRLIERFLSYNVVEKKKKNIYYASVLVARLRNKLLILIYCDTGGFVLRISFNKIVLIFTESQRIKDIFDKYMLVVCLALYMAFSPSSSRNLLYH